MTHGTNLQLYDFKLEYTFQDNALAELDRPCCCPPKWAPCRWIGSLGSN